MPQGENNLIFNRENPLLTLFKVITGFATILFVFHNFINPFVFTSTEEVDHVIDDIPHQFFYTGKR